MQVFGSQGTSQILDNLMTDWESQTSASGLGSEEWLKNVLKILSRNQITIINNR
jgi:hypothetical protein